MLYIYLEGHDFTYDLYHLSKVFFPDNEITFLEDRDKYEGEGHLVESIVYGKNGKLYTRANIYIRGQLRVGKSHSIDSIDIGRDSREAILKTGVKKTVYEAFLSIAEREAPWGILMGIRPVKLVHNLLDKGKNGGEILNILTREYKLDMHKSKLIVDIASKQRKHIYPLDGDRFSLYISIPFCPSRCIYCSFPSEPISRYVNVITEYRDRLIWEIRKTKKLLAGKKINTVYIGGGTPTSIPSRDLEKIIQEVYLNFGEDNIKEFTVEAGRPDTITKEKLSMLNRNNINRISINPQTMNNETLKLIGRCHKKEDIDRAYYLAKETGIKVINMDLIVGLPSEGQEEIISTLEEIKKLDPENLTIHTLAVKRGSKFSKSMDKYSIQQQEIIEGMLDETANYAYKMGLAPYYLYRQKQIAGNFENIGYSKEGRECIYNILIMEEKESIIGIGMGAVSKIFFPKANKLKRVANFKSIEEYMRRTDELIERKRKGLLSIT